MQQIEKESRGQRCQRRRSEPAPATPPHTKQKKKKRSSKNRYYTTRIPLPLLCLSVCLSVGRSQNPKKNFGISKHMIISKKIGFPKNKQKNWNFKKHYQDSPSLIDLEFPISGKKSQTSEKKSRNNIFIGTKASKKSTT